MTRLTIILLLAIAAATIQPAHARVRLENICTVHGQQDVHLTGIGLVVGLAGTGDGPKSLPTIRFLARTLELNNASVGAAADLREAKNVAVVLLSATVPGTGVRRGQKIDCKVSTIMGAKSLRGGRLLSAPLETANVTDATAIALAQGDVYLEESEANGRVRNGAQILIDPDELPPALAEQFQSNIGRSGRVTLLLDRPHASYHAASEVARVVNGEFSFEANGRDIARAVGPGEVEVLVVDAYRETPVDFIAQLLDVALETPHAQARVVVNPRTKVVVVTGEVEISPVVITHENLTITVGGPPPGLPEPRVGFVEFTNQTVSRSPQRLQDLVAALNGLKVPTEDVIEILRELHETGKLHAEFVEN